MNQKNEVNIKIKQSPMMTCTASLLSKKNWTSEIFRTVLRDILQKQNKDHSCFMEKQQEVLLGVLVAN